MPIDLIIAGTIIASQVMLASLLTIAGIVGLTIGLIKLFSLKR